MDENPRELAQERRGREERPCQNRSGVAHPFSENQRQQDNQQSTHGRDTPKGKGIQLRKGFLTRETSCPRPQPSQGGAVIVRRIEMIFTAFQAIPGDPRPDRLVGMQWSRRQIDEPKSTCDHENEKPKTDHDTRGE